MTGHGHPNRPASDDAGRLVIRRAPGAGAAPAPVRSPQAQPARGSAGHGAGDWAPLLVWIAALAVAVAAFHWLGRTPLASPPVRDLDAWWSWAQGRTADELAFNLLRLLGVGLSWYLVGSTAVGALARLARAARLVAVADRLTIAPVRRVLQASLGLTLAAASTTAIAGTSAGAPMTVLVQDAESSTSSGPARPVVPGAIGQDVEDGTWSQPERATIRTEAALRAGAPVGHDSWVQLLRTSMPAEEEASLLPENTVSGPSSAVRVDDAPSDALAVTWVVEAGDHLWAIAEHVLAEQSGGQTIGENDVVTYWSMLVEANRHRLVDPGNADLILPGQVLQLPAVSR